MGLSGQAVGIYHSMHAMLACDRRGALRGCLCVGTAPMDDAELARALGWSRLRDFKKYLSELMNRPLLEIVEVGGAVYYRLVGFAAEQERLDRRARRSRGTSRAGDEELQGFTSEFGGQCPQPRRTFDGESTSRAPVEELQGVTPEFCGQGHSGGADEACASSRGTSRAPVEESQGVTQEIGGQCPQPRSHASRARTENVKTLTLTNEYENDACAGAGARDPGGKIFDSPSPPAPSGLPAWGDAPCLESSAGLTGNANGNARDLTPAPAQVCRDGSVMPVSHWRTGNENGNGGASVPVSDCTSAGSPEGAGGEGEWQPWGPGMRQGAVRRILELTNKPDNRALWEVTVDMCAATEAGAEVLCACIDKLKCRINDGYAFRSRSGWLYTAVRAEAAKVGIRLPERSGPGPRAPSNVARFPGR